jgi:hypothetical protein
MKSAIAITKSKPTSTDWLNAYTSVLTHLLAIFTLISTVQHVSEDYHSIFYILMIENSNEQVYNVLHISQ